MCKQSEFYSVIVLNFGTSEKFVSYYLLSDNANRSWQLCVYACVLEQNYILLTASMGIKMMSTIASQAMSNLRNAKLRKGNLRKTDAKLACETR